MAIRGAVLAVSVARVAAAADYLPMSADSVALTDDQKKLMMTGWAQTLAPTLAALKEGCPAIQVDIDWAEYIPSHPFGDDQTTARLTTFITRCGEALDGLAQACKGPQAARVNKGVTKAVCGHRNSPRAPKGNTSAGAWEPELDGTELGLRFHNTKSQQLTRMVSEFLDRKFPGEKPKHWDGESREQKAALDEAESGWTRSIDEMHRTCTAKPALTLDFTGFARGDPHQGDSPVAERPADTASRYYRRCTPIIGLLGRFCSDADLGSAARAIARISCEYADTDDGYRKGSKECQVSLKGTVLTARCGWHQAIAAQQVCTALGGSRDACGPHAAARERGAGEGCDRDDQCWSRACLDGKCLRYGLRKGAAGVDCDRKEECKSGTCTKGRCR